MSRLYTVALLLLLLSVFVAGSGTIPYDVIEKVEHIEIRRYPAGTWLTVPVPGEDYNFMLAYGFEMLQRYFLGENVNSRSVSSETPIPMRITVDVWNMDSDRFASVYLGQEPLDVPTPFYPVSLAEEPEAYLFVKKVRSTDNLRTVMHHGACLLADLAMRHSTIDMHRLFIAYHTPDPFATNVSEAMDEIWVQWMGRKEGTM